MNVTLFCNRALAENKRKRRTSQQIPILYDCVLMKQRNLDPDMRRVLCEYEGRRETLLKAEECQKLPDNYQKLETGVEQAAPHGCKKEPNVLTL